MSLPNGFLSWASVTPSLAGAPLISLQLGTNCEETTFSEDVYLIRSLPGKVMCLAI